ncbi:MAG: efflux RND transporter periplasmic adaptor subunit [Flavobacteriales bacterium]|nr:efflux RND transporter periplasmic adaptor subunit [Flavobacteriales bacterium]
MLGFASCHSEHEKEEEEAVYPVSSPVRMDTSVTKDYVCQIHSIQHIELRALERGYLTGIFVDEGQMVQEGQVMFQIMPMLNQAELNKAEAEANFAEIEYLNTKSLADSNVVSANELALAKAKFDKAKAQLALAQVHMQFTEIRAPFTGIMDRFHVRLGSLLSEGDLLTELSDNSKMWVYFNVPEAEYLEYMAKAKKDSVIKVALEMANHKMFDEPGYVETIEADFNNETGNIAFRATFKNPRRLLRHGETGNVRMTLPLKNALLIPQKATYEVLDKTYVYVIDEENTVRARMIETGAELPHLFEVKEGLSEEDRILLDGIRKVRDGYEVEVKYLNPDSVIQHLDLYAE